MRSSPGGPMPDPRRSVAFVLTFLVSVAPLFATAAPAPPPVSTERPPEAATLPAEGAGRPAAEKASGPPPLSEEEKAKGPLRGLEYRLIGPAIGGRVSRVAGVPGDPS